MTMRSDEHVEKLCMQRGQWRVVCVSSDQRISNNPLVWCLVSACISDAGHAPGCWRGVTSLKATRIMQSPWRVKHACMSINGLQTGTKLCTQRTQLHEPRAVHGNGVDWNGVNGM